MSVITMTLEEFHAALKAQDQPTEHLAFKCPMCDTVQSGADLIAAGAGKNFDEIEKYLAYSCIGRFTAKKLEVRNKQTIKGQGCDWTLGGLFQTHKLEVLVDGQKRPRFEPVTAEEAAAHRAAPSMKLHRHRGDHK
jgi:hypothetical protein